MSCDCQRAGDTEAPRALTLSGALAVSACLRRRDAARLGLRPLLLGLRLLPPSRARLLDLRTSGRRARPRLGHLGGRQVGQGLDRRAARRRPGCRPGAAARAGAACRGRRRLHLDHLLRLVEAVGDVGLRRRRRGRRGRELEHHHRRRLGRRRQRVRRAQRQRHGAGMGGDGEREADDPEDRPRARRVAARPAAVEGRDRRHGAAGAAGRAVVVAAGHGLEPDQRDLEVAGLAQQVHDRHQLAVVDRLVGAQEDPRLVVAAGGAVERGRRGASRPTGASPSVERRDPRAA